MLATLCLIVLIAATARSIPQRNTRQFAYECSEHYTDGILDGRRDGKATRAEVEEVRKQGLGWMRFVGELAGYTTDKVFRDCDGNRDGVLTRDDWPVSPECLMNQQEIDNCVYYICKQLTRRGDPFYDALHSYK